MSSINISVLEIVSLAATLHCLVLSLVILFSKFFRSKNNKYLGFTLLIIAIVGINNWFWDIGISRNLCNVHWHSDVVSGRMIGTAAVAHLHINEQVLIDLATTK